jgi:hypothetical protein
MSQDTRNQPSERQRIPDRASNINQDRKRYEGFDGMNYEQRRQPYNPQNTNNKKRNEVNNGRNGEEE